MSRRKPGPMHIEGAASEALYRAADRRDLRSVSTQLAIAKENRFNPNVPNPDPGFDPYWTPLTRAADRGFLDVIQILLEWNNETQQRDDTFIDINGTDNMLDKRWTATYHAARMGNINVIRFLAQLGADINLASLSGETPLYSATRNNQVASVQTLLELGADANIPNWKGGSPLQYASLVTIHGTQRHEGIANTLAPYTEEAALESNRLLRSFSMSQVEFTVLRNGLPDLLLQYDRKESRYTYIFLLKLIRDGRAKLKDKRNSHISSLITVQAAKELPTRPRRILVEFLFPTTTFRSTLSSYAGISNRPAHYARPDVAGIYKTEIERSQAFQATQLAIQELEQDDPRKACILAVLRALRHMPEPHLRSRLEIAEQELQRCAYLATKSEKEAAEAQAEADHYASIAAFKAQSAAEARTVYDAASKGVDAARAAEGGASVLPDTTAHSLFLLTDGREPKGGENLRPGAGSQG